MDSPLLQFVLYLLFIAACFLLAHWMPPLLSLGHRREHPFVAVRSGRDLLSQDIEVPGSESRTRIT